MRSQTSEANILQRGDESTHVTDGVVVHEGEAQHAVVASASAAGRMVARGWRHSEGFEQPRRQERPVPAHDPVPPLPPREPPTLLLLLLLLLS